MKISYTKVPPDVCKANRNFFKNHVRRAFVAWCAYEGYFDGVLTAKEISKAKRGNLPEDLNIHHKIPLSGSEDESVNDFSNLVVLHKTTHEHINRDVFAPQLRPYIAAEYGITIELEVPEYDYVDAEGIRQQRLIKHQKDIANEKKRTIRNSRKDYCR